MRLIRSLDADRPLAWRRLFLVTLVVVTLLRAGVSAVFPFTGDEAYFHLWGQVPDWGFYDHPPMIGWWMAALLQVSDHPVVLRAPAVLVPVVIALATRVALARLGPVIAWGTATLLLLVPLNALNVAITNDVPLMLFVFLAMLAYLRALRTGRSVDYLLAGALLGGALLSKYFAVLFASALCGHRLCSRAPGRWRALALMAAGSAPAVAIQVGWNAAHCWPNVMFNVVNRHDDAAVSWETPLLYGLSLAWVLGLPVLVGWLRAVGSRHGAGVGRGDWARERDAALAWMTVLPFGVLAVVSIARTVGLHWLAAFVAPAVWLFVLRAADGGPDAVARRLRGAIGFALAVAVLQWVALAALVFAPLERLAEWRNEPGVVLALHGDELIAKLEPWRDGRTWATDSYSTSAILGFADRARRTGPGDRVIVFGPGSRYARQDDLLTDFRSLAGRDLLLVLKEAPDAGRWEPYFDRIEHRTVTVRGAAFHLVVGSGLRYDVYRDDVLDWIRQRWYALPPWLPSRTCFFCERYFPERACHR
jgi:hypothetical protein